MLLRCTESLQGVWERLTTPARHGGEPTRRTAGDFGRAAEGGGGATYVHHTRTTDRRVRQILSLFRQGRTDGNECRLTDEGGYEGRTPDVRKAGYTHARPEGAERGPERLSAGGRGHDSKLKKRTTSRAGC